MKPTLPPLLVLFFAPWVSPHGAETTPRLASERPQVQAHCDGVPIKRFGFCWVLGEAPDLLDDVSFQAPDLSGQTHVVDAAEVDRRLGELARNEDLSRFIL